MKTVFAYFPVESDDYLCLSQNRFAKFRGDPELIFPIVPATGVTMWKKEGYNVTFIDSICDKLSKEDFINKIKEINPDLLIYETKTPVVKQNWKTVDELKKELPDIKIACVGDHVSVLPMETMENSKVDFVLTGGDFDISMLKLARFLDGKGELPNGVYYREGDEIKNSGKYELVENLDELPFIDLNLFNWRAYHEGWRLYDEFAYMMGSRGCPYRCTFCSWPQMLYGNKLRFRNVNKVLDELELMIKEYGIKEVFFDDDTFTCNRQWVFDFCDGIKQRGMKIIWSCNGRVDNTDEEMLKKMKEAGCRLIKYGIESASPETLKKIKKGYTIEQVKQSFALSKKYGILRHGTAMIGYPWESKKDFIKTIEFVKSLNVDTVQFSIPIAYPGTELFKEAEENGWLSFGRDWEKYDMSLPTLKHPDLKGEEVVAICESAWREIYFQPKFIMNKIFKIRKFKDIHWLFKGTKTVLKGHIGALKKHVSS